jgi:hypothetical protein
MSACPDMTDRTIFHFNCPLCGGTPAERRLEDFLTDWDCGEPERLERFLALIFTAIRQVRHGQSKWLTKNFQRSADVLLDVIRNGGDCTHFPAGIHADGYGSRLTCLISCPLCQDELPCQRPSGFFVRWNEACKVQTANLCFEATLVISGLLLNGQPAQSSDGIDLEQLPTELSRTAEATGLPPCPGCGRFTSCLYGPEKPYHLKGRCRWCLDADGPAISVTLNAEHVKAMFDRASKQGQTDSPPEA